MTFDSSPVIEMQFDIFLLQYVIGAYLINNPNRLNANICTKPIKLDLMRKSYKHRVYCIYHHAAIMAGLIHNTNVQKKRVNK